MSKEKDLPYFKFFPDKWHGGRISFQPLEVQGAFLQACNTYWKQLGVMVEKDYNYRMTPEIAKKLIELEFIEVIDGKLCIPFLDEQLSEFEYISIKNRENARKRWDATAMPPHTTAMPSDANKRREEEEKKKSREDIYTQFFELFIAITGKKIKVLNDKTKRQIKARMGEGYKIEDFERAIKNCFSDTYHKENPKYLTPEFITRADKLEKYLLAGHQGKKTVIQQIKDGELH